MLRWYCPCRISSLMAPKTIKGQLKKLCFYRQYNLCKAENMSSNQAVCPQMSPNQTVACLLLLGTFLMSISSLSQSISSLSMVYVINDVVVRVLIFLMLGLGLVNRLVADVWYFCIFTFLWQISQSINRSIDNQSIKDCRTLLRCVYI